MTPHGGDSRLPPEEQPGTAVLLCSHLEALGSGLDLMELRRWLEETDADVQARVVPDLCHAPKALSLSADAGAQRILLGLCSADYSEPEMRSSARKAGLDPLGMEIVNLGAFCTLVQEGSQATEKAKLLLAAAVARARAYPGSSPENLRPYLPPLAQKVSRRALFTLPPVRYRVVASISEPRCIADAGCALCIRACPHGALERDGKKIQLEKPLCSACGLCVTVCPKDAIQLPGSSPGQIEAQITALLEANHVALSRRHILFTCQRGIQAIEKAGRDGVGTSAGWLPVQVPCVGMVPVSCILQCLARGATVGVVYCCDGCISNQSETIRGRIDYCRELLRLLGTSPQQVRLVSPGDRLDSEPPPGGVGDTGAAGCDVGASHSPMFGQGAVTEAIRKLAEEHGGPATLSLEHPHSPVGIVVVDPERCSGCGVCATTCPTGSLGLRRDGEAVALTFDAGLCAACGNCVAACPEAVAGAIRLGRVTDIARLTRGRAAVYQGREARCEVCGDPVAPLEMLNRMAALLGDEDTVLAGRMGRYCRSCKGIR